MAPAYSLLGLAVLTQFVNEFTNVQVSTIFADYAAERSMSAEAIQLVSWLHTLAQILACLAAPWLVSRLGHFKVLLAFESLLAVSFAIFALCVPATEGVACTVVACLVRVLMGMSLGFTCVANVSFIIRELDESAAAAFVSAAEAVSSVGFLVGPLIAAHLMQQSASLTLTFSVAALVVALLGVAPTPLALTCLPSRAADLVQPPADVAGFRRTAGFLLTPSVLLMLLANGAAVLPLSLMEDSIRPFLGSEVRRTGRPRTARRQPSTHSAFRACGRQDAADRR